MIRTKTSRRRLAFASVMTSAALMLTACAGTGGGTPAPSGPADGIVVEGEGISTNEFGGLRLELGEPVSGGELRFGIYSPVMSLDPAGSVGASIGPVALAIFGQLMKFDANGNVVPGIAESMTTEDGATWTMILPPDLSFTDGTPFDAAAVISHVERVAVEGSRSQSAGLARNIASMSAPDSRTIEFTLREPSAYFDGLFADGSLAMIPSPTAVAEEGEQFGIKPVGAGPFKVESYSPGSDIFLVRNEDYYIEGLPYLDKLSFIAAFDENARLSAVQTGDLDAAVTTVASQFAQSKAAGLAVLEQPQFKAYRLLLNLSDPALGDERVRQALNLALDREAVSAAVFGGANAPSEGMFNRVHPHFIETGWPTNDAEAAKSLVEEYEAETGASLKLTMAVPEATVFTQIAAVLQSMYAEVGIDVLYTSMPPASLVAESASGNYQIQMREFAIPPETFQVLSNYFSEGSTFNHSYGTDPALSSLLDEAAATLDADERIALIGPMQEALADWLPMVPIVTVRSAFVVSSDVLGFPGGIPNNAQEMFDPTAVWVKQ